MKYEYVLNYSVWKDLKTWKILKEKSLLVFVSFTICALVASEPFVTFFAVPFERANHPDLLLLHEVALCP